MRRPMPWVREQAGKSPFQALCCSLVARPHEEGKGRTTRGEKRREGGGRRSPRGSVPATSQPKDVDVSPGTLLLARELDVRRERARDEACSWMSSLVHRPVGEGWVPLVPLVQDPRACRWVSSEAQDNYAPVEPSHGNHTDRPT